MYVDDVLIAEKRIRSTANLPALQDDMLIENVEKLELFNNEPIFYVEGIPSQMNFADASVTG